MRTLHVLTAGLLATVLVLGVGIEKPRAEEVPLIDWLSNGVNALYGLSPDQQERMTELIEAINSEFGTDLRPGSAVVFFFGDMFNLRSDTGLIGNGRAQTMWLIAISNDPEDRSVDNPDCLPSHGQPAWVGDGSPPGHAGPRIIPSCLSVLPLQIITDSVALADHLENEGHSGLVTVADFSVDWRMAMTTGPPAADTRALHLEIDGGDSVQMALDLEMPLSSINGSGATGGLDFGSRPYPSDILYGAEVTNEQFQAFPGGEGVSYALDVTTLDISVMLDGQVFNLSEFFTPPGAPLLIRTETRHMRLLKKDLPAAH